MEKLVIVAISLDLLTESLWMDGPETVGLMTLFVYIVI